MHKAGQQHVIPKVKAKFHEPSSSDFSDLWEKAFISEKGNY